MDTHRYGGATPSRKDTASYGHGVWSFPADAAGTANNEDRAAPAYANSATNAGNTVDRFADRGSPEGNTCALGDRQADRHSTSIAHTAPYRACPADRLAGANRAARTDAVARTDRLAGAN